MADLKDAQFVQFSNWNARKECESNRRSDLSNLIRFPFRENNVSGSANNFFESLEERIILLSNGIEPLTAALSERCATNCAKRAEDNIQMRIL
jgi:hypothetical protein